MRLRERSVARNVGRRVRVLNVAPRTRGVRIEGATHARGLGGVGLRVNLRVMAVGVGRWGGVKVVDKCQKKKNVVGKRKTLENVVKLSMRVQRKNIAINKNVDTSLFFLVNIT